MDPSGLCCDGRHLRTTRSRASSSPVSSRAVGPFETEMPVLVNVEPEDSKHNAADGANHGYDLGNQ